jgi:F0F1-type ATP synthase assembly protein I
MNTPGKQKQPGGFNTRSVGKEAAPFLTLGLQLGLSVAVFFALGYWLDARLGTAPWCSLAGAAVGLTGGFIKFFRDASALGRKADKEYKELHEKHTSED